MAREGQTPFTFHKGVVVAWDILAGTNKVRVLGEEIDDIPSLIGSEVGLVRAGDVVGVILFHNTYFVLGRIEGAGVEQRALGVVTDRKDTQVDWGTDTGPTFVPYSGGPQVSVYIGSSRRCRVDLTAWMSAYAGEILAGFTVTGASTIAADFKKSLWLGSSQTSGDPVQSYGSSTRSVYLSAADGLNEGVNVFTMVYRHGLEIPAGGGSLADRELSVQPF